MRDECDFMYRRLRKLFTSQRCSVVIGQPGIGDLCPGPGSLRTLTDIPQESPTSPSTRCCMTEEKTVLLATFDGISYLFDESRIRRETKANVMPEDRPPDDFAVPPRGPGRSSTQTPKPESSRLIGPCPHDILRYIGISTEMYNKLW